MAPFNGTCVPRSSGNCRSLPSQGDGVNGQPGHWSQTHIDLGWVAPLSLGFPGTKSFFGGIPSGLARVLLVGRWLWH